jgi:ribose/xylose/arabinose/galactoside ABC-type transport system permease subunit
MRERLTRNLQQGVEYRVLLERFGVLIGFILLIVVATIIQPRFLTPVNLLNVIRQVSIFGILAIGQTFIILTAGIDLSVGSVLALVVVLVAGILPDYGIAAAILSGLAVGALMGTINGLGVTVGKVQPFVMTLGMLGIARGLAFMYTGGMPIPVLDNTFLFIGNGYWLGVPVPAIIYVILVILAALVLKFTPFGRFVYAIGSNEEAARLSGVNVRLYKTLVYSLGGFMSGVAGVLYASQLAVGPPIAGEGYELDAIAAVVVGGTSLFGGEGSMFGTFLGAAIIGSMANILNLTGVSPFVQKLAKGLLIIAAVMIQARSRKN